MKEKEEGKREKVVFGKSPFCFFKLCVCLFPIFIRFIFITHGLLSVYQQTTWRHQFPIRNNDTILFKLLCYHDCVTLSAHCFLYQTKLNHANSQSLHNIPRLHCVYTPTPMATTRRFPTSPQPPSPPAPPSVSFPQHTSTSSSPSCFLLLDNVSISKAQIECGCP